MLVTSWDQMTLISINGSTREIVMKADSLENPDGIGNIESEIPVCIAADEEPIGGLKANPGRRNLHVAGGQATAANGDQIL